MCLYWWRQQRKADTEGQGQGQGSGEGAGRSLFFGTWIMSTSENFEAFLKQVGGIPANKMAAYLNERQEVHFEPNPNEPDTWLHSIPSEIMGDYDIVIKFGVKRRETLPVRVPSWVEWTMEGPYRVVTLYTVFDNRQIKVIREIKPGKPNRMITWFTIEGVTAQKTYTRVN